MDASGRTREGRSSQRRQATRTEVTKCEMRRQKKRETKRINRAKKNELSPPPLGKTETRILPALRPRTNNRWLWNLHQHETNLELSVKTKLRNRPGYRALNACSVPNHRLSSAGDKPPFQSQVMGERIDSSFEQGTRIQTPPHEKQPTPQRELPTYTGHN